LIIGCIEACKGEQFIFNETKWCGSIKEEESIYYWVYRSV